MWVLDQVRHKPACTCAVTENGKKYEISHLKRRGIMLSKEQKQRHFSFMISEKLLCVFVFTYADRFSHDAAQI